MWTLKLITLFGFLIFSFVVCDLDEGSEDEVTEIKKEYVAPVFHPPTIPDDKFFFVDWFGDVHGIGKKWRKSIAKKDGNNYDGKWEIGLPPKVSILNDFGLIVKTKAKHHAIAANLKKPFYFTGKPLVVQYEVKYEDGQECGGGYLKLLSLGNEKIDVFHDKTPYTIMFGPDKCGMTSKVHLIIRHKNPKNNTISEHHAKQSSKSLSTYFEDKKTHLYTLIINSDNSYSVLVDNSQIMSGNLLTDLEPSVVPPKQIFDPNDKKPVDWDDRETIVDENAKKPDDWDENAPKEIIDEDAVKPDDWLEDEEPLIIDETAKKPDDWDESMDGTWEPKKIENPKCEKVSGCGKWTRPKKPNPNYKGKWSPPKISNPAYKGRWSPRLIENPHYFEANPYKELTPISAIGFELWTMSSDIIFDNIIVTDDVNVAREFSQQTFNIKVNQEKLFEQINNPQKSMWASVLETTKDKPWLWAVFVLALLIPIVLISIFCFGKKSSDSSSYSKKTDAYQVDDAIEDSNEEDNEDNEPKPSTSKKENSVEANIASSNQDHEENDEDKNDHIKNNDSENKEVPTRRTRVRRAD